MFRNPPSCVSALAWACLLIGATGSAVSMAQSMNAEGDPCTAGGSTVETAACFDGAYKSADHDLKVLYARVQKVLNPEERIALSQAEREWEQYRDATCSAERALYGGGTGGSPTYLACLAAETRSRNASLLRSYGWRLEQFGG